jgi:hypothetical protein
MFNTLLAKLQEALEQYTECKNPRSLKKYYRNLVELNMFGQKSVYLVETLYGFLFLNVQTLQDARDIMKTQYKGYEVISIREIKCKLFIKDIKIT